MLSELLVHAMGWDAVWYAHPGKLWWALKWPGRWHVGTWTGPHGDLICVRRCDTREEAERYLSPSGKTIFSATIKAVICRLKLEG